MPTYLAIGIILAVLFVAHEEFSGSLDGPAFGIALLVLIAWPLVVVVSAVAGLGIALGKIARKMFG